MQAFWSNYFYLGTQMANIAERIKEERQRLGLSQDKFGGIAGVSKQTVIAWEKGTTSPTIVQLSELAAHGLSAKYVLTGNSCGSVVSSDDESLNNSEKMLLSCMRKLIPEYQEILSNIAESMIRTQSDRKAIKNHLGDDLNESQDND